MTPGWPPVAPGPVKQNGQVRLPAASRVSGPPAETATVPVALGMVMVLAPPVGVAKVSLLVVAPFVAVRLVKAPWRVRFWMVEPMVIAAVGIMVLTARIPLTVTVV